MTTLNITSLSVTTFSITSLGRATFSIITLSTKILNIKVKKINLAIVSFGECYLDECRGVKILNGLFDATATNMGWGQIL